MLSKIKAHMEYMFSLKSLDSVNNAEMRVIGLGRSGIHPIINWIGYQCKGSRVLFINNPEVKANPFEGGIWGGLHVRGMFDRFYIDEHFEKRGKFRRKDCLIYNYEVALVEEVVDPFFEKRREQWLGKSVKKYDVLIMRDAFNFFASKFQFHFNLKEYYEKRKMDVTLEAEAPKWIKVWKNHALEFLGITNILSDKKVTISYNAWCKSKVYRMAIANKLDLNPGDKGLDRVPNIGAGSSFEGIQYDKKASEMKTDERWKRLKDNEAYRNIFTDTELVDLSNRIFGKIPGTDILL
ncbi:hypothetical protein ACFL27_23565 [candidate division CSSED10-310 bacterium]|uniref:Sulfotransferase domain-containing protein n=1 Tax=candidate division CSSED10-310 bacterium TaxID=2855610 RepID=A0ABV6Z423_UNCC1